jgi:hypothetical protein
MLGNLWNILIRRICCFAVCSGSSGSERGCLAELEEVQGQRLACHDESHIFSCVNTLPRRIFVAAASDACRRRSSCGAVVVAITCIAVYEDCSGQQQCWGLFQQRSRHSVLSFVRRSSRHHRGNPEVRRSAPRAATAAHEQQKPLRWSV